MEDRKARLAALAARAGRGGPTKPTASSEGDGDNKGGPGERPAVVAEGKHAAGGEEGGMDRERTGPQEERQKGGGGNVSIKFRNYTPSSDATRRQLEQQQDHDDEEQQRRTSSSSWKRPRRDEGPTSKSVDGAGNALREAAERAKREAAASSAAASIADDGTVGGAAPSAAPESTTAAPAPKKMNWDLKRDVQWKLDKLEKRTQRAIVQLLKERIDREAHEEAGRDGVDDDDLD